MNMKQKASLILKPIWAVILDLLILFPILLSVYLWSLSTIPLIESGVALAGAYLLGAAIRRLLLTKNRLFSLAFSLLLGVGAGFLIHVRYPGADIAVWVFFGVLAAVSGIRGVITADRPLISSFPKTYTYLSLIFYFLAWFLYGRILTIKEFQSYLLVAGFIAIPAVFLVANSEMLVLASREELKESTSMPVVRRNNRAIVLVTLLIGLLIAGFQTLKEGFLYAVRAVLLFIVDLIRCLFAYDGSPNGAPEPLPEGGMPVFPVEETRSYPFWDAVVEVLGILISIALVLFLLFFLGKQLIRLWQFLSKLLKKLIQDGRWAGESEGFRDEKESLMDWQAIRQNYRDSLRDWWENIRRTEPKWNQLTDNRQRVRFLYRHLMLEAISSGYRFRSFFTPKETIDHLILQDKIKSSTGTMLEDLYGKARYGREAIPDSQVEQLKDQILP